MTNESPHWVLSIENTFGTWNIWDFEIMFEFYEQKWEKNWITSRVVHLRYQPIALADLVHQGWIGCRNYLETWNDIREKTHPLLHIKLEQNFIFKKRHLKCVPTFWGIKNPWIINLRNTDDLSRSSCGVLVRALVFQP